MNNEAYMFMMRKEFHAALLKGILHADEKGIPSNADKDSKYSRKISKGILNRLGGEYGRNRLAGQRSGSKFEDICKKYIEKTFLKLRHIRPGDWEIKKGGGARAAIAQYFQYEHLAYLEQMSKENPKLAAVLGSDYLIKPDIVISRVPEKDENINVHEIIVDDKEARLTPIRKINNELPILHASISCKWTIRSDRAQNARSEGLNLGSGLNWPTK